MSGGDAEGRSMDAIYEFLAEVEKLKGVERQSWTSTLTRRENSAEHSWHLAIGLLTVARELKLELDLAKALRMALVHDLCEIDAGDVSVYAPERAQVADAERAAMDRLATYGVAFAAEARDLWLEYEAQQTLESRWVRVLDRLMPFVVNLATGGKSWIERGISRSQVLAINAPIAQQAPELYGWVAAKIDECVARGWLRPE